jgi:exonuclease VII large subunit
VLKRGYAVVRRTSDSSIVKLAAALQRGEKVSISLADGSRDATVE